MEYLPITVSILALVSSFYFSSKSAKKTDTKDLEKEITQRTETNLKLDNIARNVADIKYDMSTTKNDIQDLKERVIRVDESAKQAHKRLDTIEARVEHNENNA